METDKIQFNILTDGPHTIEIRHGEALPLKEPEKLDITSGNLNAITEFIIVRKNEIDWLKCHLAINRRKDSPSATLIINETDHYNGKIKACLQYTEEYRDFGINTPKAYSLVDLANFIKMHRYCFADPAVAMKLTTDLRNFKAKVNKEIEKAGDIRGNKTDLIQQVVETNIPEAFDVTMPIFKGHPAVTFRVEIGIYVRDAGMECYLESVEANDIVVKTKDEAMDELILEVKAMIPDLFIYEV